MKRFVNSENKRTGRIMLIIVVLIAVFFMKPQLAKADIASGTWGTCPWSITDDGTLVISSGTGSDAGATTAIPWYSYRNSIKSLTSSHGFNRGRMSNEKLSDAHPRSAFEVIND